VPAEAAPTNGATAALAPPAAEAPAPSEDASIGGTVPASSSTSLLKVSV